MEREVDFRQWDEMIPDALGILFKKLSLQDILTVIPMVCKAWGKAAQGPYCWQEIDIDEWCTQPIPISSIGCSVCSSVGLRSSGSLRVHMSIMTRLLLSLQDRINYNIPTHMMPPPSTHAKDVEKKDGKDNNKQDKKEVGKADSKRRLKTNPPPPVQTRSPNRMLLRFIRTEQKMRKRKKIRSPHNICGLNLMDGHGQPALLYIVPFTVGLQALGAMGGELKNLWTRGIPEWPCPHARLQYSQ